MDEQSLETWIPEVGPDLTIEEVIDQAFDYRGDVTIHTRDGRTVTGYVFDRQCDDADNDRTYMRIIAADGDDRITLYDADVLTVTFTGRDPAAGKSWEAWVKRYIENKTKDEAANIEPESLE